MLKTAKGKRKFAWVLAFLATGAIACVTHNGVSFDVNVGAISVSNIGSEIGQRLEDALGNQFGRDHHVAGVVR